MARGKNKGQQYDRIYTDLNKTFDNYIFDRIDQDQAKNEIIKLINKATSKEPKSDYEKKDKTNLLQQLTEVFNVITRG